MPENVVEALVGEASSRLDPLAQQVMQAVAVYPVPVPPVAVDYLLQPYREAIDGTPVLSRLVKQFARRDAGRYYLHQVDRDYALHRVSAGQPDAAGRPRRRSRSSRCAAAAPILPPDPDAAGDVVATSTTSRPSWPSSSCVARTPTMTPPATSCWRSPSTTSCCGATTGWPSTSTGGWRAGSPTRVRRRAQRGNLGAGFYFLGEIPRAIEYYSEALRIAREIGDRLGEASWVGNLGNCYATSARSGGDHLPRAGAGDRAGDRRPPGRTLPRQPRQLLRRPGRDRARERRLQPGAGQSPAGSATAGSRRSTWRTSAAATPTSARSGAPWATTSRRWRSRGDRRPPDRVGRAGQPRRGARRSRRMATSRPLRGGGGDRRHDRRHPDAVRVPRGAGAPPARRRAGGGGGDRRAPPASVYAPRIAYTAVVHGVALLQLGQAEEARQAFAEVLDDSARSSPAGSATTTARSTARRWRCPASPWWTTPPARARRARRSPRPALADAAGIVERVLRLFDALAACDPHGVLDPDARRGGRRRPGSRAMSGTGEPEHAAATELDLQAGRRAGRPALGPARARQHVLPHGQHRPRGAARRHRSPLVRGRRRHRLRARLVAAAAELPQATGRSTR